jgi:membrane protein implicated in regulation of membrane protease activity
MKDVFLLSLALGAVVLVAQIVLGLLGMAGDLPDDIAHAAEDGVDLLSVRTVSAGAALFGAAGLWASSVMPVLVAVPLAAAAGVGAAVVTAYMTRQMLRLESSGSLQIDNALGQSATVYLPVPPHREGTGKVQLTMQGRTVEMTAVGNEDAVIPTGAAVIVVGVIDGNTVEVTPTPLIEGIDT